MTFLRYILFVILSWPVYTYCQDPYAIIKSSFDSCQTVSNGYYEMKTKMKFMTEIDTLRYYYKCYFKKDSADTIFGMCFHYKKYINNNLPGEVIYSRDALVNTFPNDSSAIVRSTSMWANDIRMTKYNHIFYEPLTSKTSYPFFSESGKIDTAIQIQFIGEENANSVLCYHISVKTNYNINNSNNGFQVLRTKSDYWIGKKDMRPVHYSMQSDIKTDADTLIQYFDCQILKYQFNIQISDSIFQFNSLPSFYKVKTYEPVEVQPLLTNGTVAPNWRLPSSTGDTLALENLHGKIVLIDFFYKSCQPCISLMPHLVSLFNKYRSKDFIVVGIDPIDKDTKVFREFIKRKDVNYPILFATNDIARLYKVSSYPTTYLLNKEGIIVFSITGYHYSIESIIDEMILKADN